MDCMDRTTKDGILFWVAVASMVMAVRFMVIRN